MTDLFTPPMPAELVAKLEEARVLLWNTAGEIDKWLQDWLFEETWAECHRTHEGETFKLVNGQRVPVKVTFGGTPDFNEFDRRTHRYEKQVSKLRWLLWDIHKAATGTDDEPPVCSQTVVGGEVQD